MEKMENNKKMKKGIAGITLVALVVTIVVLLILAAISISMLTGENGILTQAQNAKDETELASIREELQIMWIEVQTETANKNLSKEEIAKYFEDKIKEKDPDATVKYNKQKNIYEISYKDHLFEIKAGQITMDREEALEDVKDVWEDIDKDLPKEEQADKIEEGLQEKDPDSSAEYNPDTGKIEIDHGGENIEIDEDGNIEIVEPEEPENPNINIDTDGDGEPDINIDTDDDGEADINIDTDGDKEPDINIDTDGDKDPDINIDTDGDGDPDINIDTDGDKDPDINIDTDGDGDPDINIDTDGDKDPDINIDTDDDKEPDINIDTDDDGEPDINIDTDGDKDPDINIDTDGDKDPDINIDTDGDGEPDINIDTDGDKEPDINIDTDGDKDPDINIDTDGDGEPDINIDTDGDKDPDINIDTDGDGDPDINIDTDGDKDPDINIDTDGDKDPDINIDTDGDKDPDINIDTDGDREPDINIDLNGDGKPDINIDTDEDGEPDKNIDPDKDGVDIDKEGDGTPDINVDTDDDGDADINIDTDWDGEPDINIDLNGDGKPDINIDTDGDGEPDKNIDPDKDGVDIDKEGDGTPDINVDTNDDGKPDINIDTDWDGEPDINIDTDGDKEPDINIDTDDDEDPDINIDTDGDGNPDINIDLNGDGKPDINIDEDGNGEPDKNIDPDKDGVDIDKEGDGTPDINVDTDDDGDADINIDTDWDGEPDINIDLNGDGKPDINIDTDGDGEPDKNIDPDKDGVDIDKEGDGTPDINVDTNDDGKPDINIDTDWDGEPDINIDTDGDKIPDINIDTNGDGEPDIDIDTNDDGIADKNVTKLAIVENPMSIDTISNVNDVSFEVKVTGAFSVNAPGEEKITYQWYYNTTGSNEEGTEIVGANEKAYTIPKDNVTASISGRYYYVKVTQEYRGKTNVEVSEAAKLTVISEVEITKQPTSVQTIEGQEDISFTVEASGLGDVSYQWYYKTSSEGEEIQLSGENEATLTIPKEEVTKELNGRYYFAKVTQSYGMGVVSKNSNEALLTVAGRASIEKQPSDITITEGRTATFEVKVANEIGDITYQWYKNTEESNQGGEEIPGAKGSSYTTEKVTASDNNTYYYCVVTQNYGSSKYNVTSNVAKLTVGNGVSVSTLNDVSVIEGITDVTFTVTASGEGTFTYKWYKNTTASNEGGELIENANSNTYKIAKKDVTTALNDTYYYVEVTQSYGSSTETIKSNAAKLSVVGKVTIDTNPSDVSTFENVQDVTFRVVAGGEGTKTYQWYKNTTNSNQGGQEISGAIGDTYTIEKENITTDLNNTYYYVVVTQKYGNSSVAVTSNSAKLEVKRTEIEVSENNVTAYVGGESKKVTLSGENAGEFIIDTLADPSIALAEINPENNNELVITPVAKGETSVTIRELNGNKTTKINIEVLQTTIKAEPGSVLMYVGGQSKSVALSGDNTNEFVIETKPKDTVATANISGKILTINPVGVGTTSVVIKETNGNQKTTVNIEVKESTIDASNKNVTLYVGGQSQSVTITGENQGALSISQGQENNFVTPTLNGNTLTISPKAAGETDIVVKEANGNKEVTIHVEVKATTIDASNKNVIAYVGGSNQTVTISGTNAGAFSIETQPNSTYATASLSGTNLTITPKAAGKTSVIVKEANGNQKVTINIEVRKTTITAGNTNVTAYVGGSNQTVTISGTNAGTFSIATQPNSTYATASISGSILTITPKAKGTTSVVVKESNGNQKVTININVIESTITASPSSVTAYVGGGNKTVTIGGSSLGKLSISTQPTSSVATAALSGSTLTITPKGSGKTSVTVKESNGGKTVTINITVLATSITAQTVQVYAGGSAKTVTIQGSNMGTLSIKTQPNSTYATASLSGKNLTITPKSAGTTSLVLQESNGNKTATINISVLATSITANPESVTAYVGGGSKTVTLGGTNAGSKSIVTQPNGSIATASISGNTLTITPKAAGDTSVVVKEANGNVQKTINIKVLATSIDASNKNVILYVGGSSQTVTLSGENAGAFSIDKQPDTGIATASINNKTITISPKTAGTTSVIAKEANGNQKITINIEVRKTSIVATPGSVTAYVGGSEQTVTLSGTYMGTLTIESAPNGEIATASLEGNILKITPKAVGNTNITIKEANGGQTTTISIKVIESDIKVSSSNVTAYVGGIAKEVTINGTNIGSLTITGKPKDTIATASLDGSTLTISPVGAGTTSVTVRESNGNKAVTVSINVLATSVNAQSVNVFEGGSSKSVTVTGNYMGSLSIESGPNTGIATVDLNGTELTVTPVKAGTTNVVVKEANGNAKATISITVTATSIDANNKNVTLYVGGSSQNVTISGTSAGTFSIETKPTDTIATASLANNILTIRAVGAGETDIVVKEANGNKEVTIHVEVKATTIDASNKNVIAYVGGSNQTVTISGTNAGAFSIETQPNSTYATASLSGTNLTITPKAAGKTSVIVKEANGNQKVTINIEVRKTTITAGNTNVTAYVGGSNQTVTISGTNAGTFSIATQPNSTYATASISGSILTITPKAKGTTSVVVKESNGNQKVTININVIESTITASPSSVTAYVGGGNKTVTIGGSSLGKLSISTQPTSSVATAALSGSTLTITPKGSGKTSVTVKESNGGKTVTINITVLATSITAQTVQVYAGGSAKTVTIQGSNMGTLSIKTQPNSTYATASLSGKNLTITPKSAGTTSLVLQESNGNKTATINISVLATSITANPESVTAYVGGGSKTVTLGGTNAGSKSIVTQPNGSIATASISGNTLTITPKAAGDTSVVVKEANGNVQKTINIKVLATSIDASNKNVTLYVGGSSQKVTITGNNKGALSISSGTTNSYVTPTLSGDTLTLAPKAAGTTNITIKEANGGKTVTIAVTVKTTTISASPTSVTAYVGGGNKTVTLSGTNAGGFSIVTQPNSTYATASISGSTLTITPKAQGDTSVVVKESNGNKQTTVSIKVLATTLTASPTSVTAYVGGGNKTVTLSGNNKGTLSITSGGSTSYYTASISGSTLTISPKAAGSGNVVVKEANGGKTVTIPVTVKATTLTASPTSVTAYVGGGAKKVTIGGSNKGSLSITTQPNSTYATASLSGSTLTITPKAQGDTSVVVKEANGGKTVTIPITVKTTTLTANPTSVTAYVSGGNKTVTLSGDNKGTLSITSGGSTNYYTASISGNTLTISPKAAGSGKVVVKEANGGKTVTISVTVKAVTLGVSTSSVTAYTGGNNQTVIITGTNYGSLSVSSGNSNVATGSISGTTLTITPKGDGTTTLTVKEGNAGKTATVSVTVKTSSITASSTSVTAYVGGGNKTVTINGSNMGSLSISGQPTSSVATASLSGSTLTITPKGSGKTNITVKESNAGKTATIKVTVLATSITGQTVQVYAGGSAKTVTIQGSNMGTLSIKTQPNTAVATASISGTSLTVTPKAAGTTSLVLTESNGNKTATINITVSSTSITASPSSVTANVSDGNQTVTLGGTNHGTFSIVTQPNSSIATASISGSILTIVPKAKGETSVVVKEGNGNKTTEISIVIINLSEIVNENTEYEDENGDIAWIPKGYSIVPGLDDVSEGLVISDVANDTGNKGNQFVWIPVPKPVGTTSNVSVDKPMATENENGYTGVLYDFHEYNIGVTNSTIRFNSSVDFEEPTLIDEDEFSGFPGLPGHNDGYFTKESMQNDYNNMIKSVEKYYGFYVGRYELGLEGTEPVSKNAKINTNVTTADSSNYNNTQNWYGLYCKAKEYATLEEDKAVVSSMMWGSQYNAMLNWMQKNGEIVNMNASSLSGGNKISNNSEVTGYETKDIIRNVYDLFGCHYEWTLEGYDHSSRTLYGGSYKSIDPPSGFAGGYVTQTQDDTNTRITLYIKTGDEEQPDTEEGIVGEIDSMLDKTARANVGGRAMFNAYVETADYTYYVYKADTSTGKGKRVTDSRVSVNGSGTTYTVVITNVTREDAGYYYLVADTPEGLKQTNTRTELIVF